MFFGSILLKVLISMGDFFSVKRTDSSSYTALSAPQIQHQNTKLA
jgi:hypothetical protein